MHARVASFENVDLDRMREANQEAVDSGNLGMPEGVRRAMVFADRDGKRSLFVTFFDSPEAIQAAARRFEEMGDEYSEDIRGRRTSVDVYEVVFDEEIT
jgi:hypothetical protein